MAIDSTLIELLRNFIDDTVEPYEFSDDRLLSLLYTAATYVNIDINGEYEISFCDFSISPEPSGGTLTLIALKAACLLIRSQHTSYSRSDFRVTDGPASVDIKGAASNLKGAADSVCAQYEKLKFNHLMNSNVSVGGYAITTPSSES